MKKLSKKEIILIILLAFILVLAIGLIIFKIIEVKDHNIDTKPNTNISDNDKDLDELVNKINNINKLFDKIDLDSGSNFDRGENVICYPYNGNDSSSYLEEINKLYLYRFTEDLNYGFDVFTSTKEDGTTNNYLYVCKPNDCKLETITTYKKGIITDESKELILNGKSYFMIKMQNEFKFIEPVIMCKN